jgi:hypothetical protein
MSKKPYKTDLVRSLDPDTIALNYITFLASDQARLQTFCTLTGMTPASLPAALGSKAFLAMVLDYALQDESLLLDFAASAGLSPKDVAAARQHLPGAAG